MDPKSPSVNLFGDVSKDWRLDFLARAAPKTPNTSQQRSDLGRPDAVGRGDLDDGRVGEGAAAHHAIAR
jgi:hypothetical protein